MNDISLRGNLEKDSSSGIERYIFKGYIENNGDLKKSVSVQLGQGNIGLNEISYIENMAKQPTKEFSATWNSQKDLIVLGNREKQQIQKDYQLKSKTNIITVTLIAINQI